jgi:hypothetical protein
VLCGSCPREPGHLFETNREDKLGSIIAEGRAKANTGIPVPVSGYKEEGVVLQYIAAQKIPGLEYLRRNASEEERNEA